MFKQLRRKLAFAYVLLAGLVLAAVTMLCLHVAETQLEYAAQTAFESGVNAIIFKLQSEHTLSQSWLAQSEAGDKQIIYVEDNGKPLSFKGAWQPRSDRDKLISSALECADEYGLALPLGSLVPEVYSFELTGEHNEQYMASVVLIPQGKSQSLRVAVVRDTTAHYDRIANQRGMASLIATLGLLVLAITGWIYSGRAVRPAEESQRRQLEFTAMASHELKAPLAVISASVSALNIFEYQPTQAALLSNISSESMRMARLIEDLLTLSRADARGSGESKSWSLAQASVEVDTLIIECYELFAPIAHSRGLKLEANLPDMPDDSPAIVKGDAERLKQILAVLCDNALTYTEPGGHVSIGAHMHSRHVSLYVEDDGPGIPDAQKKRLFERFYRAEQSHHDRNHFGLGLPIAAELTQLHGGKIYVENVQPHGARFIVALPRYEHRSAHKSGAAAR